MPMSFWFPPTRMSKSAVSMPRDFIPRATSADSSSSIILATVVKYTIAQGRTDSTHRQLNVRRCAASAAVRDGRVHNAAILLMCVGLVSSLGHLHELDDMSRRYLAEHLQIGIH